MLARMKRAGYMDMDTLFFKNLLRSYSIRNALLFPFFYHASVQSAKKLKRNCLRFIEVVITATKQFSMSALSCRGDHVVLVSLETDGIAIADSLLQPLCVCRKARHSHGSVYARLMGHRMKSQRWCTQKSVGRRLPKFIILLGV